MGLAGRRLVALHLKQSPRLSKEWGPPQTAARYRHPWFGPLDAAGWHALAATHMGVHRRQLERILAALDAERS